MRDLDTLRYPVGPLPRDGAPLDARTRGEHLAILEQTPATIRELVERLGDAALDTPYRPGGWTVRQVVHHVPDSHMNAYIRMKFAATEDAPAIKAYDETKWAELPEAKSGPADMSVALLDALHRRWVMFLRALTDDDFAKVYVHPELGPVRIDEGVALYAWHCRHHAAHIKQGLGLTKQG